MIYLRKAVMMSINPNEIIEEGWNSKAFFSLGYPIASPAELGNNEKLQIISTCRILPETYFK
ncbi:MAG: hypothetical protein CM1200mP3_07500 [Chloroflexota bacterium]|nr:MAG: hypothetical protein CM1200mP3_07500 [Chloroflexota bacterium]